MITLSYSGAINKYRGLSTDTKPTASNGSEFFEINTGKTFYFNADGGWVDNSISKQVKSAVIKTAPTKVVYVYGDDDGFDITGAVLTVTYTDNTTADKNVTYLTAPTELSVGQTAVEISYVENGMRVSASQAITVHTQNELKQIDITTDPTTTTYTEGDVFDPTGMVVKATYWGEDVEVKTITDYTYSPAGELETTDTTITVSYTEGDVTKTDTVTITVSEAPEEDDSEPSA